VAEEKESKGAAPEKKGGGMMKFIIMGVAVLVLAGGGFFAYQMLFAPKADTALEEEASEPEPEPEAAAHGGEPVAEKGGKHGGGAAESEKKTFTMETFVVNLSDPGGKRYLKTNIDLDYPAGTIDAELISRLPQLRDLIILLLSSKTLAEIQTYEGKIALRQELIQRINQTLTTGKIRNLYFTQFVIQ